MIKIRPRETVIMADDFHGLVEWYRDVLGFKVTQLFTNGSHYANMATSTGIEIGIALVTEIGIEPGNRTNNTVVLQIEVDDLPAFFEYIKETKGGVAFGPSFNEKDEFWFGSIADPEGNQIWVVDSNCP